MESRRVSCLLALSLVALSAIYTVVAADGTVVDECRCSISEPHPCYDIAPSGTEPGNCTRTPRMCQGCHCDIHGTHKCAIKEKLLYHLDDPKSHVCHLRDTETTICGEKIARSANREIRTMETECDVVGHPNYERACTIECFPPHFGDLLEMTVETTVNWYNNVTMTNQGPNDLRRVTFSSSTVVKSVANAGNGTEFCLNDDDMCLDQVLATQPPYFVRGFAANRTDNTLFTGRDVSAKVVTSQDELLYFKCPGTEHSTNITSKALIQNRFSATLNLRWEGETSVAYKVGYLYEAFD